LNARRESTGVWNLLDTNQGLVEKPYVSDIQLPLLSSYLSACTQVFGMGSKSKGEVYKEK